MLSRVGPGRILTDLIEGPFKKSHQQSRVVVPGTREKGTLIKFQLGGASSRKLLYYIVATVTNCVHQKLLR